MSRIDPELGFDPMNPQTLDQAKTLARRFVAMSIDKGAPCAFEIIDKRGRLVVQPFGLHFGGLRGSRTVHIEPLPASHRAA